MEMPFMTLTLSDKAQEIAMNASKTATGGYVSCKLSDGCHPCLMEEYTVMEA